MARNFNSISTFIQLGSRLDTCILCEKELKGTPEEYMKKKKELQGALEGKPCLKLRHSGSDICICLEHIHKLAKENPIEKKEDKKGENNDKKNTK